MSAQDLRAHHAMICEQHLWSYGVDRSGPVLIPCKGTSKVAQHIIMVSSNPYITGSISYVFDVA